VNQCQKRLAEHWGHPSGNQSSFNWNIFRWQYTFALTVTATQYKPLGDTALASKSIGDQNGLGISRDELTLIEYQTYGLLDSFRIGRTSRAVAAGSRSI